MLLSSGGQRPGTLPNTLQCTGEGRLPTERSPVDTGSRPARPAPAAGELRRAERALEETAQASGQDAGLSRGSRDASERGLSLGRARVVAPPAVLGVGRDQRRGRLWKQEPVLDAAVGSC